MRRTTDGQHVAATSAAAVLLALATIATALVLAATAGASSSSITFPQGRSQTWLDDADRQVTATLEVDADQTEPPSWNLVVLRDVATGQPDATWTDGGAEPGRRTFPLTAPADGAFADDVIAADGTGAVTVVWHAGPLCAPGAACQRWFQVIDSSDGTAGAPSEHASMGDPLVGLADGSILTGTTRGPISRRASDGSALPTPFVATESVEHASIDRTGRLLLALDDRTIVRHGTEPGDDLDLDSGCAAGTTVAVGPSAIDDGFATACGALDAEVRAARWSPEGVELWSATDGIAPGSTTDLTQPDHAIVDSAGAVWVGGVASLDVEVYPGLAGTSVARFTETGPEAPLHQRGANRPATLDGFGIGDLRPVLDGRVAFSADHRCCNTVGGPLPFNLAIAGVLPERPSPPTCTPGMPSVKPSTSTTPVVIFRTCADSQRAVEQPTSYRAELVGPSTTRSRTIGYHVASTDVAAVVTQVRGGEVLIPRAIAVNAQGDSLGGAATGAKVILPFASIDQWAQQQYLDLLPGPAWAAERASVVAALDAGTLAPADLVASLLDRGVAEQRVEPVARTYQAALGRLPDSGGLRYWTGRSAAGVRLAQIAQSMSTSPEFVRRYGGLSNRGFVVQVYRNVLGREGDPTGIAYWTRRMEAGLTRGGLVAQFAQSSELIRRTDPTIQPLAAAFLLFGRVPTPEERTAWATATPRATAARAILPTATYARRFLDWD